MIEPESATHDLAARVATAARAVAGRAAPAPQVAIVLGSGLGAVADAVAGAVTIPTSEIPHWPASTVPGHSGRLVLGRWRGVAVAVMAGRSHRYEGHSLDRATFGVRVLHALGARTMIFTNAAGGVGAEIEPGDLMLATDHLNGIGRRGLFAPDELRERRAGRRAASYYDPELAAALAAAAARAGVPLRRGVLLGMLGPSYETAAEIRLARRLGVGAVCMSTVHEVTVAAELGCRAASLSTIANLATGLGAGRLSHAEVTAAANAGGARLGALLDALLAGAAARSGA